MKRGEIWTVSGTGYAGKPRPAVIVQSDFYDRTESITLCAVTTHERDAPLIRIPVLPSPGNGLRAPSHLMIDKLTTVPKQRLGVRVGQLDDADLHKLDRAIVVFLGLA